MPHRFQSDLKIRSSSLLRKTGILPQDVPVSKRRQDNDDEFEIDVENVAAVDSGFNADGDRLVAQVTAVNVLSQVQKMQDEIQVQNSLLPRNWF